MAKTKNKNLHNANKTKNDEFYTQLTDIEKELKYYHSQFENKIVYCNCDYPEKSNFFKYFATNFDVLKLKKIITTHFAYSDMFTEGDTYKLELDHQIEINREGIFDLSKLKKTILKENGDFRSAECIEFLKEADIVVTNPPFSLFREYVAQLIEYDKKFLIIGNKNAITYKEIFPLIKNNKLRLGYSSPEKFINSECEITKNVVGLCRWFSNLAVKKYEDDIILCEEYAPEKYLKYDNYNAINIDKTAEIPKDYDGVMGVPISFLDKYNPKQFEILGIDRYIDNNLSPGKRFSINRNEIYARILIKKIKK